MHVLRRTVIPRFRGTRGIWPLVRPAHTPSVATIALPRPQSLGSPGSTSRWPRVAEPAVTVTDYILALEASLFAARTARQPTAQPGLRSWLTIFFGSISAASLAGGTVHGFFPHPQSMTNRVLWTATYVAIGVTTLATWAVGTTIACPPRITRLVTGMATVAVMIYLIVALFVSRQFVVAVAAYVPATTFLLVALVLRYQRTGDRTMLAPAAGVALTFIAAAVQVGRVTIHPRLFDHNALYHLIQAAALALLFIGVGSLLDSDRHRGQTLMLLPPMAR